MPEPLGQLLEMIQHGLDAAGQLPGAAEQMPGDVEHVPGALRACLKHGATREWRQR